MRDLKAFMKLNNYSERDQVSRGCGPRGILHSNEDIVLEANLAHEVILVLAFLDDDSETV